MNYELIQTEVEQNISALIAAREDCRKKIAGAERRLSEEQERIIRLEAHKKKLLAQADESLADTVRNEYEKFKVAIKKVNSEIEAAKEAIEPLQKNIIPRFKAEYEIAVQKVQSELLRFWKKYAPECQKEMCDLLAAIVVAQDDFQNRFSEIFNEAGTPGERFINWNLSLTAIAMPTAYHERVERFVIGPAPKMTPLMPPVATPVMAAKPEPVQTPPETVEAVTEPQAETTPAGEITQTGEVDPDAGIDGYRHLENMIPLKDGGAERRPGTVFIARSYDPNASKEQ